MRTRRIALVAATLAVALGGCEFVTVPDSAPDEEVVASPDGTAFLSVDVEPTDELPGDFGTEGVDYWIAKLRHGDGHNPVVTDGIYELEVGLGHAVGGGSARMTAGARWVSRDSYPFAFALDANGTASLAVTDGPHEYTAQYSVGGASGDIYVYPGVDANVSITVSDLRLNGQPLMEAGQHVLFDDAFAHRFVRIGSSELDLSAGFLLEGTIAFDLGTDPGASPLERPTLVLKIPF